MSSRIPRAWTSRGHRPHLGFDLWLAALLAVTAAVWALGTVGDRLEAGPPLAFADGFPGPAGAWLRHGPAGDVVVAEDGIELPATSSEDVRARLAVALPPVAERPADALLRVRARTETLAAPVDDAPWRRPLVMIWVIDDEAGETPVQYRTVTDVPGEPGAHAGERVIRLPPGADSLWLVFQGRDSGGSYRLAGASLELVAPKPVRLWLLAFAAAAAAALGLVALGWLVRRGGRAVALALALVLAGTIVGILVPESISTGVLRHRLDDVAFSLPKLGRVEFRDLYKVGHFGFFFAGAFVAYAARRRFGLSRTRLALLFATLAVATEGVQLHLVDRTTRGSDVVVDLAGVALAALLVEALTRLIGRGPRHRPRGPRRRRRPGRTAGDAVPAARDGVARSGISSQRSGPGVAHNPPP